MLKLLLNIARTNALSFIVLMTMILCIQQVHVEHVQIGDEKSESVPVDENNTDSDPATAFNIDQSIISSNLQFNVNHNFYEIKDIDLPESEDDFKKSEDAVLPDDYRKVLFSQVISPNAP